jgi:hypothetical protein
MYVAIQLEKADTRVLRPLFIAVLGVIPLELMTQASSVKNI